MSCQRWYVWTYMATISIPKSFSRTDNLVAVPRTTYEEFLAWQKRVKSRKTFVPTAAERRALARSRKNFARGKYITLEQLEHELDRRR